MCDFGFARFMGGPDSLYTDYVSTRWYRAPELLVGDTNYGPPVDVWAIGCLFAEIYNGQPLFPGNSDLHTLSCILEALGNVMTEKQKHAFFDNPIFLEMRLPEGKNIRDFRCRIPEMEEVSLHFLSRCLEMDPNRRLSCLELLRHPYFEGFGELFEDELKDILREDAKEMHLSVNLGEDSGSEGESATHTHRHGEGLEDMDSISHMEPLSPLHRVEGRLPNSSSLFGGIEAIQENSGESLEQTVGGQEFGELEGFRKDAPETPKLPVSKNLSSKPSYRGEVEIPWSATFNPPLQSPPSLPPKANSPKAVGELPDSPIGGMIIPNSNINKSIDNNTNKLRKVITNCSSSPGIINENNEGKKRVLNSQFVNPFLPMTELIPDLHSNVSSSSRHFASLTKENLKAPLVNKVNITFSKPLEGGLGTTSISNNLATFNTFNNQQNTLSNLNNSFTGKKISKPAPKQGSKRTLKENADFKNAPSFLSNIFGSPNEGLTQNKSQLFPAFNKKPPLSSGGLNAPNALQGSNANVEKLQKATRLIALPQISDGRLNEKFYMKTGGMLKINDTYLGASRALGAAANFGGALMETPIGSVGGQKKGLNETYDETK